MARLSRHRIDAVAAHDGKWFTFADEIRFKLRRSGSPAYREFVSLNHKKYEKDFQTLLNRAISEAIIVDWEGIDDETEDPIPCVENGDLPEGDWVERDGMMYKQLPYSPEAALEIISNPEYEAVVQWIDTIAALNQNFAPSEVEKS